MNYDVILNANDSATLETQYAFTQGDYGQIQFSIRVKADRQYVTNAQRAYIVFTLSNGMIVTGADMPKSVATYTYVFQGNELQSPGKVVADVKLVYSNGQISSNKFTFMCRFDPLADKSVPAAPYITALQKIVDEGQEKINYLQTLIDAMQGSIGSTTLTRDDLQNTRNPVSAGAKAIDAQMAQYLLLKGDLVNNALATTAGVAPLDSAMGKTLQDQITTTNGNLNTVSNSLAKLNTATLLSDCDTANDTGLYYYNNSTSHTPVASTFGFVRHSKVVSWHYQEAFPTDGGYYIRRKIDSGAWTAWIAK